METASPETHLGAKMQSRLFIIECVDGETMVSMPRRTLALLLPDLLLSPTREQESQRDCDPIPEHSSVLDAWNRRMKEAKSLWHFCAELRANPPVTNPD